MEVREHGRQPKSGKEISLVLQPNSGRRVLCAYFTCERMIQIGPTSVMRKVIKGIPTSHTLAKAIYRARLTH
jgi:hypothetical protein